MNEQAILRMLERIVRHLDRIATELERQRRRDEAEHEASR